MNMTEIDGKYIISGVPWQPDFGRSIKPISRGTDYAHIITTGTPRFSDLLTALIILEKTKTIEEKKN